MFIVGFRKSHHWREQQRHPRSVILGWPTFSMAYSHRKWRHKVWGAADGRKTAFFSSLLEQEGLPHFSEGKRVFAWRIDSNLSATGQLSNQQRMQGQLLNQQRMQE